MDNHLISRDSVFDWSSGKNSWLITHRGLRFEDVVLAIANGSLLAIFKKPANSRHPHQKIFVVEMAGYAYLVPFVEQPSGYFLKTIIPSRRATRKYLRH
jgi:hypothetical protein